MRDAGFGMRILVEAPFRLYPESRIPYPRDACFN
jgi:hypothetical protein